jgi:hypothetical protein
MKKKIIDTKNMDNAKDSESSTEDLLVEITSAESALIERFREDTKVVNKHIHDNHWNWK